MREDGASLRRGVTWGAIAFGVVLALIIGMRLEQAALTVVVGAACGVGASIPTGMLIVLLMRRRETDAGRRREKGYGREIVSSPPVVVVAPPSAPQLPQPNAWPGGYTTPSRAQREFTVIGEEAIDDEYIHWQG